jgi:glycosyltransferase involved in cell wall biosynthesis
MVICFFNDSSLYGGGEHWTVRAAQWLAAHGDQVVICCPAGSPLALRCTAVGVPCSPYERSHRFREQVVDFLSNHPVDLLYVTVMGRICEARRLSEMVAELLRRPVIVLRTGLSAPLNGAGPEYYGIGVPGVAGLHVVCGAAKDRVAASFNLPARARGFVSVLRQGVDVAKFNPARYDRAAARATWNLSRGEFTIVCVTRIMKAKGLACLIEAFRDIHLAHPQTRLIIAGEGDERSTYAARCRKLRIASAVTLPGHVDDVPQLLAAADAFCLPSLNEGLPNAVAEAMAMALPVVATRTGGILELVRHNVNGLLCQPGNVPGLKSQLSKLLDNAALRARLGAAAAQAIRRAFDFDKCMEEWRAAVMRSAGMPRPAPRQRASRAGLRQT